MGETMSEYRQVYEQLMKVIDDLKDSIERLTHKLERLETTINALDDSVRSIPFIQLCRDQMRDLQLLDSINNIMRMNIQGLYSAMKVVRDNTIVELENVDKNLEENLTGLLLPVIEFKKETKVLEDTLSGLRTLLNDMIELLSMFYQSKKEPIMKKYEEVKQHIMDITNETSRIREDLKAYSIKSPSREPSIIGVPIVKIVVENTKRYEYLGRGLERYETKILEFVGKTRVGIDYELLQMAVERLGRDKGLFYRLFLKKLKPVGGSF